jgi:hypothetical protein
MVTKNLSFPAEKSIGNFPKSLEKEIKYLVFLKTKKKSKP